MAGRYVDLGDELGKNLWSTCFYQSFEMYYIIKLRRPNLYSVGRKTGITGGGAQGDRSG